MKRPIVRLVPPVRQRVREALPAGQEPGSFAQAFVHIFEKELVAAGIIEPEPRAANDPLSGPRGTV